MNRAEAVEDEFEFEYGTNLDSNERLREGDSTEQTLYACCSSRRRTLADEGYDRSRKEKDKLAEFAWLVAFGGSQLG